MNRQGYQRVKPYPHPEAVLWWFVREFDDGFVFARGGRCRTTRVARHTLRALWDAASREHAAYVNRPTHALGPEGELVEIDYGPYGLDRLTTA